MKRWTKPGIALWVSLVLLAAACNTNAEPTFSPEDAATRLAQIPTAAVLNPTRAAPTAAQAQVPSPTRPPEPAPIAIPEPATPVPVVGDLAEYTVQAGDTLSTIAFKFNISMAAIQIANNLGESQVVKIGQTLKVPQSKSFPDENVLWVLVEVKPGETLGGICQRYGVKLDDAVRVNNLRNASDIRAGQELIMPVSAPAAFVEAEPVAQAIPTEAAAAPPTLAPPAPSNSEAARNADIVEIIPIVPLEPIATPTSIPETLPEPIVVQVVPQAPERTMVQAGVVAPLSSDTTGVEAMRAQILALYNQARVAEGVAPLAPNWALQQAAQLHAEDCALRGFGSHTGSDGANTQARVGRAGFGGRVWGENWAWARTVDRAFEMWFTEEYPDGPHRRNILSPRYAEVGFGIVPSKGGFYFIADFGAP
jgi:uncharacterized protein YkwD